VCIEVGVVEGVWSLLLYCTKLLHVASSSGTVGRRESKL